MHTVPLKLLAAFGVMLLCPPAVLSAADAPDALRRVDVAGKAFRVDALGRRAPIPRPSLAPLPAPSGTMPADWTALGPPGADVSVIAGSPSAPDLVFAGVAPGGSWGGSLYRSTDDGATWAKVPALAGLSVFDIAITAAGSIYLATQDGVRMSSDDGATWTALGLNIGLNNQVNALAIDPGDASTVWIGIADAMGSQPVNLMRSIDGGLTWHDKTPPLAAAMTGTGIAIDPHDSDTVIATFAGGFGGGAVWVSTDAGASWTDRSAGLPDNALNAVAYDGTRLLIGGGQLFGSQYVGLYGSTDLGATWVPLHDASWPLRVVTGIAVDPDDARTILVATDGAGINRSSDGGATWEISVGGIGEVAAQSLHFHPGHAGQLFLGATSLGVYRSEDHGATFASSGRGMSELALFSITASPLTHGAIAVAFQGNNSGGVFSSTDGGLNWILEPVPPTRYSAVGYAPDGRLYAISSGPSSIAPEGLYRREADGTWTGLGPDQGPYFESDLAALRFSANDPDLILLGGADFGVAGFGGTVWRSADAGAAWTKAYLGPDDDFITDIEIVEDGNDQTLVASYDESSAQQQGGALRSIDGGLQWSAARDGLPAYLRQPKLCASPAAAQTFYLSGTATGGQGALWRSTDAAQSWTRTTWSGGSPADIACDARDDQVLYLATFGANRVVRSDDQGDSFTPFDNGLGAAGSPTALAVAGGSGGSASLLLSSSQGSFRTQTAAGADAIFANGFEASSP